MSIIVTTEGGVCYWLEARDDVKHPKIHRQSLHNREVCAPHVSQAKVEESCSGRSSSALSEFKSRTGYRKETGKYNKARCDGKSVSYRICTQVGAFVQSLAASKSFKKHSDRSKHPEADKVSFKTKKNAWPGK